MSIEAIIAAALKILDHTNSEELSIRNVAATLGSSTATLYRRVGGRPGLDALIVDEILGEARACLIGASESTWQDSSIARAEAVFDALARHPRAVQLFAARVPTGPNASFLRERAVSELLSQGFSSMLAARTYTTIGHYTLGFGLQLQITQEDGTLDTRLPATAQVAGDLRVELHEEFRFGLRMLTDGIATQLAALGNQPRS